MVAVYAWILYFGKEVQTNWNTEIRAKELARVASSQVASVMVFVLFLLYPTLSTQATRAFVCIQLGVDDTAIYLKSDLGVQCWQSSAHILTFIGVSMPMLIIYLFGVPALNALLLKRNKDKIKSWMEYIEALEEGSADLSSSIQHCRFLVFGISPQLLLLGVRCVAPKRLASRDKRCLVAIASGASVPLLLVHHWVFGGAPPRVAVPDSELEQL